MWALYAVAALAEPPPELGVVWGLTIDGVPVGTQELRVRYEGETGGRVRIVEAYTEITARRGRFAFRQRLTANSQEGAPASVHAVSEAAGVTREVQARFAGGAWHVEVQGPEGARSLTLHPAAIDLSWVDLFDPESDRRLAQYDVVKILSVASGEVLEGRVMPLGPRDVSVGGEVLWTEGFALWTATSEWRFWYAANGFLVRYEEPRPEGRVDALMLGAAPRAVDEFQVPAPPRVEEVPLP